MSSLFFLSLAGSVHALPCTAIHTQLLSVSEDRGWWRVQHPQKSIFIYLGSPQYTLTGERNQGINTEGTNSGEKNRARSFKKRNGSRRKNELPYLQEDLGELCFGFPVSTAWISLFFLFLKKLPGCC